MPRGKRKKNRKAKEPFVARMRRRGRETHDLGRTLVQEPRAFPGKLGRIVRRSLRTIWSARGGGYYACGFVLTFIWLEISTLASEVAAASGVWAFLSDQLFEFLFRFSIQSLTNTVQAFIWPALVIREFDLWGIGGMLVGYVLFAQFIKEPLTAWLFEDAEDGV